MKKAKVLTKPTRLSDLSFDDMYVDDYDATLKAERLSSRKQRRFKNEMM